MAQEFLDHGHRDYPHCEMRGERVPEGMPSDRSKPGLLAEPADSIVHSIIVEWLPLSLEEHVTGVFLAPVKQRVDINVEWDVPRPTVFGRDQHSPVIA
jgi:hypothetical protein